MAGQIFDPSSPERLSPFTNTTKIEQNNLNGCEFIVMKSVNNIRINFRGSPRPNIQTQDELI